MDFPIDLPDSGSVVGNAFHGTSEAAANIIERQGFKVGYKKNLYCGQGVYFWDGSQAKAVNWARDHHPGKMIAVLQASISLKRCLDLCAVEIQEQLKRFFEIAVVQRRKRLTPAEAIALLATVSNCDTVRLADTRGSRLFDVRPQVHEIAIIICVRNLACINSTLCIYKGL